MERSGGVWDTRTAITNEQFLEFGGKIVAPHGDVQVADDENEDHGGG
jgi:hypothetical protein